MQSMSAQGRPALTGVELLMMAPGLSTEERTREASLFSGDLLHAQVRTFNPKYKEAEDAP
jgi:hypothetical protein